MEKAAPRIPTRTPILEKADNIFRRFNRLVIFDAPTGEVKWHISNVRATASDMKLSVEAVQAQIRPRLLKALRASPLWTVQEVNDVKVIAKITMVPTATRRNNRGAVEVKAENAVKVEKAEKAVNAVTRNNRRNLSVVAAPVAATSELVADAVAASVAAAVALGDATGAGAETGTGPVTSTLDKLVMRRIVFKKLDASDTFGMITIMKKIAPSTESDPTRLEKALEEFSQKTPESEAGMKRVLQELFDLASETTVNQEKHPLYIELINVLKNRHSVKPYPIDPIAELFTMIHTYFQEGSKATSALADSGNSIDLQKEREKFYRMGLFAGFLVRNMLLSHVQCEIFYRTLTAPIAEELEVVRLAKEDDACRAILAMIIRAGPRLVLTNEAHAFLAEAVAFITRISERKPPTKFVVDAKTTLDIIRDGWDIEDHIPFYKSGAPPLLPIPRAEGAIPKKALREIAAAVAMAPRMPPPPRETTTEARARVAREGLGEDISRLFTGPLNYPVIVEDADAEENFYLIKIHHTKMGKEGTAEKQAAVTAQIEASITHSPHWRRNPPPPGSRGVLMVLERIVPHTGLGPNPLTLKIHYPVTLFQATADGNRVAIELDLHRLHAMTGGNKARTDTLLGHLRRIIGASRHWAIDAPPPGAPPHFFAMIQRR